MKKERLALLLAVLMALSLLLCGCGSGEKEISGTITPAATTPAQAPEEEPAEVPTEAPAEAPTEEHVMSLGRMEGGTYTNTYMGFAMDLDSSWTYYSAEELQDIPENVAEMFEESELGESIDPLTQITDMLAENIDSMTTINVLYQRLDMQERVAFALLDEEAILDASLAESDAMIEAYAQAGIDVSSMEKVSVTFLGEERLALKTTSTMEGVPYYTLQLFDYHLGEYSATITFASFVEDQTESLLALCYPIGE